MREEKKIVSWALIILFLSLTIIYSLVYMRKREVFLVNEDSKQQDKGEEEQEDNEKKQEQKADTQTIVPPVIDLSIGHEEPSIWTRWVTTWNTQILETGNPTTEDVLASTESLHLLSGTSQFFGILDIIDILGVQPAYTLQDTRGNYFAYYGEKTLDFVRTVQQLGGNVYMMATESEILENQLFGDKVSFINMLAFKDKFVLMVVEIEGETWLIQLPADKYHHEKPYLKSLFIP